MSTLNREPNNTHEAQQMALALQEYVSAAAAEQSAREKFDGHSWGYYGAHLIAARDDAAEVFTKRLDCYIDARVLAIIGKLHGFKS